MNNTCVGVMGHIIDMEIQFDLLIQFYWISIWVSILKLDLIMNLNYIFSDFK